MTDEFELTLHSPLTKEDWNKLSDAEHENTMYVTFQTPQGRQMRYIKCEVLNKIIAEIETDLSFFCFDEWGNENSEWKEVKAIINKYKAESEDKNGN